MFGERSLIITRYHSIGLVYSFYANDRRNKLVPQSAVSRAIDHSAKV